MPSETPSDGIVILVENGNTPMPMSINCIRRGEGSRMLCGLPDFCTSRDESLRGTVAHGTALPVARLQEHPAIMQHFVHASCDSKCRKSIRCLNQDDALENNAKRPAPEFRNNPTRIIDSDENALYFNQRQSTLLPPVLNMYELGMSVTVMIQTLRRLSADLSSNVEYNEFMWRYRRMCASLRCFQVGCYSNWNSYIVVLIGFSRTSWIEWTVHQKKWTDISHQDCA
jgi:hypothetical protein